VFVAGGRGGRLRTVDRGLCAPVVQRSSCSIEDDRTRTGVRAPWRRPSTPHKVQPARIVVADVEKVPTDPIERVLTPVLTGLIDVLGGLFASTSVAAIEAAAIYWSRRRFMPFGACSSELQQRPQRAIVVHKPGTSRQILKASNNVPSSVTPLRRDVMARYPIGPFGMWTLYESEAGGAKPFDRFVLSKATI